MDRYKVSKTGDCRKLLGQPYGRNASSMTKIRSMFTLICCSLAGLKMSLRTGFCCRNVLAQDKIKVHRKLYLSLPHIACFICSFGMGPCYRRQYWDGTFSPANFLHLLTCKFFTCSIGMAPSHLQFFSGGFFTCSFGMAPSRAAKFTAKKIINGIIWRFCHNVYTSPVENAKFTENKNDQRNRGINLS